MKKISVIVPVYNVEKYLEKCLDSLIGQTLEEIEIIVINDASPDKSNIIMKKYQTKYPDKIKCIYLEKNLSQGGARNKGIQASEGEYITFVDSDDFVDSNMCEIMYKKAKETNSDIVFCDIYRVFEETNEKRQSSLVYKQQMGETTKEKREQLFMLESYPVAKIIRKSIITDNELWFPEHMKYEDRATVNLYYAYVKTCAYVRKPLYYYVFHKDSTTTKNGNQNIEYLDASRLLFKRMKENGIYDKYPDVTDMVLIKGMLCGMGMPQAWEKPDLKGIYNLACSLKQEFPYMDKNKFFNLDYGIETWNGRWVLEQSECSYKEFVEKYNLKELSLNNVGYEIYYSKHIEKIEKLFSLLEDKNIVLWGAGKKGKDFLKKCDNSRRFIYAVTDMDKSKQGKELETGHKIVDFQKHISSINVVLVVNSAYFGDIYNYVKKYGTNISVINLDAYIALSDGSDIENYIE